jgi:demethylmenaquinone methyltransferase/2-methoxy-6-polyprenyl-1,4-benzoquinol methylase
MIKLFKDRTKISRVPISHEEAKNSYNRISKWYDFISTQNEKKFIDIGLQKLSVNEGEMVLEFGFGTGYAILKMAQSVGNSGKVYGIDISEGMYRITHEKVEKAKVAERVCLRCEDALNLQFETNFFNAIFMSFTLELFDSPEIPMVLKECQRVLRKDGRICVVSLSKVGKISFPIRFYEYLHEKFPKYVDCRPIYCKEIIESVGFHIVDVKVKPMWGLPVEIVLASNVMPIPHR